jgi:ribosomal protein L29
MNEYKGKTTTELQGILSEKREALHSFRFAMAGSKTKNVKTGRTVRKEIAKILSALSQVTNTNQ